ncbi:MAG: hypothetical protein QF745_10675, partial [Planctomycetota bacterium]|nr:hypothetical protein [Planctomycetota bacterium]
ANHAMASAFSSAGELSCRVLLAPPAFNMEAINDTRPDLKGGKPEVSRLTHKPTNQDAGLINA